MSNKKSDGLSRKDFLKKLGAASAVMSGLPIITAKAGGKNFFIRREEAVLKRFSANDHINVALIGAGMMGQGNGQAALEHDGVKLTAVCDLYQGRLDRCKEFWGDDLFYTMDYREILERDDVDAVVISSTDHWHEKQTVDALAKGKAVYLEKPITQTIDEAHRVIDAEKKSGKPLIIGSQRTSSIIYEKARDLYAAGEIGELNFVEGYWDRFSAIGAWQYSMPPSASPENVDWDTYLKDRPRRAFDPKLFFRWRNYNEFGTGVAGDLFVHLFSGLHLVTGSKGPDNVMATGGLRYWKDGRDAADVMLGLYDYPAAETHPAFNMSMRVNFADGSGGGSRIRLVGTEGEMEIGWNHVTIRKAGMSARPGMTIGDFSEDIRNEYREYYAERYPETRPQMIEPDEFVYRAPEGYNDRIDHFGYFFDAVRNGTKLVQDGTFGLRAAGPALLANKSHEERKMIRWNPETMRIRS